MDVFQLRHDLVSDYAEYVQSFIHIRDPRIRDTVEQAFRSGLLWPDPLVQLNPAFAEGATIPELVREGLLHEDCERCFTVRDAPDAPPRPLRLHRHQEQAIRTAARGVHYVLTTGTGSGKSLTYIVPVVDHVLRTGSGKGIRAIVVYPMNALANSQQGELEKFLVDAGGRSPVRFATYTGQESHERKQEICEDPPDILLTNYVMLELILTRPDEDTLVRAAQDLRFLVFDELHTYRGRQGADVALLIRRVRETLATRTFQCVGTSATLASEGTHDEQREEIARVASTIFGEQVRPEDVIGETLRRTTPERDLQDPAFVAELRRRIDHPPEPLPTAFARFVSDPLASWIESTLGVEREPGSERLVRRRPRPIVDAARDLAALVERPHETCRHAVQETLLAGYRCEKDPATGFSPFAFRLHQFLSRGDTVYATLEPEDERHLTVHKQVHVPGDKRRRLFPLLFCRECGQEYYPVRAFLDDAKRPETFEPHNPTEPTPADDGVPGYLHLSTRHPWPLAERERDERLPEDWIEPQSDPPRVRPERRKQLPLPCRIDVRGDVLEESETGGTLVHFVQGQFRFCLGCGVSYDARQHSDFPKLGSLGSEGRSTATTILSLATHRQLQRQRDLEPIARKLLSFTDNRQDASLQAGHLNDFVEVSLLRAAIHRAASDAGPAGLRHERLPQAVFDALDLPFASYAIDPGVRFGQREETERALREVLAYRIYRDLQRGWRITSPNLEQCGLLQIEYGSLDAVCAAEDLWQAHPAWASLTAQDRRRIARVLLDHMRRELAIRIDVLQPRRQEEIQALSNQRLREPWRIDEEEQLEKAPILVLRPRQRTHGRQDFLTLSGRSGFGQFLARELRKTGYDGSLKLDERDVLLRHLLEALREGGLVARVLDEPDDDLQGYQLDASAMIWRAGDGTTPYHDPVRMPSLSREDRRANAFFVRLYREIILNCKTLHAREHTAQVPNEERKQREILFREAKLPVLYCSPTMELGIDIRQLNVVNLRNVPPTPANYAQRSGRAGRSGQPALVFTYCSKGSPHDQHFFQHPDLMVSGQVRTPRLDLANEDLLRAHVHALWLKEVGLNLGRTLKDVVRIDDEPRLPLQPHVVADLRNQAARERAHLKARRLLATLDADLAQAPWYRESWLDDVFQALPQSLDLACERWRSLYRAASRQIDEQHRIATDPSRSAADRQTARNLRKDAEQQRELLLSEDAAHQSDFYAYRYFASEGFLPGYNFPRLPLSAYIPSRRERVGRDEFVSRPRFLAISEFGPRNFIYHEGARFVIHRVIHEFDESSASDGVTTSAKRCDACGYLHEAQEPAPDLCEHCGAALGPPLANLFRLRNVATRRRERISCDEEERTRMGYDIVSAFRFPVVHGRSTERTATIEDGEATLARLTYGHAATLWRINLGWKTSRERGFVLDVERGYWEKNQAVPDRDDPMSRRTERVTPFVQDARNCLVVTPTADLADGSSPDLAQMTSLQTALQRAIQVVFQLEDSELAVEALPSKDDRRAFLLYEASEGGAGVLRQILDDANVLPRLAAAALELCHFDPHTGDDLRRAPRASEDCGSACYDCLLSYTNQTEHALLDRAAVRPLLLALRDAHVATGGAGLDRDTHADELARRAGSDLERRFLAFLRERGHRLPDQAQRLFAEEGTRPDFVYDEAHTVVYVDGPPHDFAERQERDRRQEARLEDSGWLVLRFHHADDWARICDEHPSVFGVAVTSPGEATPPPAPDATPRTDAFDPDLFDAAWHPLLERLAATPGVAIEPGEETVEAQRVLGLTLARVAFGDRSVVLIDAAQPEAEALERCHTSRGDRPLLVHVASPDALQSIHRALELTP